MYQVHSTKKPYLILLCIILFMLAITETAICEDLDTPCDEPIIEEYRTIDLFGNLLLTFGGGKANCECVVSMKPGCSGTLTVKLYKYTNGAYQLVQPWTRACPAGSYTHFDESTNASSGTYKLVVTIVSGSESDSMSKIATY